MVDGNYVVSLLGCANLIELVSARKHRSISSSAYVREVTCALINLSFIDITGWWIDRRVHRILEPCRARQILFPRYHAQ